MAGFTASLHVVTPLGDDRADTWPVGLLRAIAAFSDRRGGVRGVARITWFAAHGIDASEWAELGLQPSDVDLAPSHETIDVVERDFREGHSLADALRLWHPSAWSGLALRADIAPEASGFPAIYGSARWSVFWYRDRWHARVTLEYPSSHVGRDTRWPAWLAAFADAAARAIGREVVSGERP
jgi:hypothetical protein